MKIRQILILVLSGSVLFYCKNYEEYQPESKIEVRFRSKIGASDTLLLSTLQANDEIGVFMKEAGQDLYENFITENAFNKKFLSTEKGNLTSAPQNAVYYPSDGSKVDFVAYYPYTANIDNLLYNINISNQNSQEAISLLYSDNLVNIDGETTVNLSPVLVFSHQLSKLVFNVKAGTGIDALNDLTVSVSGMKTKAAFSLKDASITPDNSSINDINLKTTALNTGNVLSEAVLIPENSVNGSALFTLNSGDFRWDFPSGTKFEKRKIYIYDIELKKNGGIPTVETLNVSIVDWNSGGIEDLALNLIPSGDGSYSRPYSIRQLNEKIGETDKWIVAYIVGFVDESGIKQNDLEDCTQNANILLASAPDEINIDKCIPVEFTEGSLMQACLNLVDNPDLMQKKVKIKASVVSPLLGSYIGLKDLTEQEGGAPTTYTYAWTEIPVKKSIKNSVFIMHYLPERTTMRNYSMLYDKQYKLAYWVAYPMHTTYLGSVSRNDDWGYDPSVEQIYQALLLHGYAETNLDRGHQLPSGDRTYSLAENKTTFYFTNMTPQNSQLNQGVWASLESKVREWTKQCDTLYVVSGSMITSKNDSNITFSQDNNYRPVAKPKYYYKALAKKSGSVYYTIAYKIDNVTPTENDYNKYKLTISELEAETGFIFFPNIPASVKNTINNSIWQ